MPFGVHMDDPREVPDEQNPAELLKRIKALEERSTEIEQGILRMASYQGVVHVLKDIGPK